MPAMTCSQRATAPMDSVRISSTIDGPHCAAPDENGRTPAKGASLAGRGGRSEAFPASSYAVFDGVGAALIPVTAPHRLSGAGGTLFLLSWLRSAAFIGAHVVG